MAESHSSGLSPKLLTGLENILNEALRLDAASSAALAKLENRWVKFSVTPFAGTIYMVAGFPLRLTATADAAPDLEISGSPLALLKFLHKAEITPNLTISGDQGVAERLSRIGSQLDIDWEAKLAEHVGDISAHFIGKRVREALHWLTYAGRNFLQDAEEYIHHETGAAPDQEEVNWWRQEVDTLSVATDQLDERLCELERKMSPSLPIVHQNQVNELPEKEE